MDKLIKQAAEKLDASLDFDKMIGGITGMAVEFFDGKLIEGGLTYGVSKAPVEYHPAIQAALQAYIDNDFSGLSDDVAITLNRLVDVPGVDEEDEGLLLEALSSAIFKIISKKISK
jgi:hypothetical protein